MCPRSAITDDRKAGIPAGWEAFVNADGIPFFFDRQSGRSVWELPTAPASSVPTKDGK